MPLTKRSSRQRAQKVRLQRRRHNYTNKGEELTKKRNKDTFEQDEQAIKKKGKKLPVIILVLLALILFATLSGGEDEEGTNEESTIQTIEAESETAESTVPEYKNISNSEYARDGQKCIAYRVVVSTDLSDDELIAVFNDVCADDDYYLHMVYFYSSEELADGSSMYDVALLEETEEGAVPSLTRAEEQVVDSGAADETKESTMEEETSAPETEDTEDSVTLGESNALRSALSYLDVMAFSYSGLIDQLEYEGYTTEEATYGVDNCGADWSEQALLCAENYLDAMAFSYSGLIDQLEYEGFSTDEATYGVDNCGADWNEQAALKAQEYLDVMSFSRADLIDQLEYEGFTTEQAEYGVEAVGY